MATKAELEAQIKTLRADAEAAFAGREAAEDAVQELQRAHGQHHSDLEEANAKAAALQDQLTSQASKHAAAMLATTPTKAGTPLGTLACPEGLLMLGDTFHFEQEWAKKDVRSKYAVDFYGPHAEYLAHRPKNVQVSQLADGVWRITAPDVKNARMLASTAERWLYTNEGSVGHVEVCPIEATALKGKDACREGGAGLVVVKGRVSFAAAQGKSWAVSAEHEGGKLVGLHLKAQ